MSSRTQSRSRRKRVKTSGSSQTTREPGGNFEEKPSFSQEVAAVFGIFISIFIYLSLFSYTNIVAQNWSGRFGLFIASGMFEFIGWAAYLFPTLLVGSSILFFRSKISFSRLPYVVAGLTGAIISFCGLLSALSLHDPSFITVGGFVGKMGFTLLDAVVGHGGTLLIFLLILLLSLMIAVRFSPYLFIRKTGSGLRKSMEKVGEFQSNIKSVYEGKKERVTQDPKLLLDTSLRGEDSSFVELGEDRRGPFETVKNIEVGKEESGQRPILKKQNKAVTEVSEGETFTARPIARGDWQLPPLTLLAKVEQNSDGGDSDAYYQISQKLEQQLENFGVKGRVIGISPGPVVTTYEYSPAPGIKINKISGLADDLALGLKAKSVRVAGSIPGKVALGIEIPNKNRQIVPIRDLIGSEEYRKRSDRHKLVMVLGLDVAGSLVTANLSKMPHLLIAGATGSGKSVAINTLIASLLYSATPEEVRFLMIDPKRIELSGYEGIPHLLHPVVVEPKLASRALNWAVREMERRYRLLEEAKVKSFDSYNKSAEEKLPYIVIIVDELADLMMVASKDVETAIARLAQMARAAGMHVILATQRPSVDVLTGLIKANFPTRISFKVSSKIDSRTILDTSGAEHLLGMGDMLFLPNGEALNRVHGAYISEKETAEVVEFWREQGGSTYDESMIEEIEKEELGPGDVGVEEYDELYDQAVAFVSEQGQASISSVQRRLRVGYNRAARMIEMMEHDGIVGPADGSKPREVIVRHHYIDI